MSHRPNALIDSATSPSATDALDIWQAGVDSVKPENLFTRKICVRDRWLTIDEVCEIDLARTRRLIVVGAGKASAAMAVAFYHLLASKRSSADGLPEVCGWINAPEGTFDVQLPGIYLHAARPEGVNMPTQSAVYGTQEILKLVSSAGPDDVVLCLISGGGSALLVAPQPGISLAEKQSIAKLVAAAGGDIRQLNTVRRAISRVKGGGLPRACTAGRLVSLIISDVLGDPLDVIASGPTVADRQADAGSMRRDAIEVFRQLGLLQHPELQSVVQWLTRNPRCEPLVIRQNLSIENIVLGNNADAVDAAGVRAVELGYRYVMQSARQSEGDVQEVAEQSVSAIYQMFEHDVADCWISGGEPSVRLPEHGAGQGGRNQQLCLSVLERLTRDGWPESKLSRGFVFLSGGTDGEDGPTDAAGAYFDASTFSRMRSLGCDPTPYGRKADAYNFFSKVGGLLKTGPTGTNVCDLRIALGRKV